MYRNRSEKEIGVATKLPGLVKNAMYFAIGSN